MADEMSLIDEIYDRMNDDTEIIQRKTDLGESELQKFFAGKTLFITGVTGFMGKILLEKLLRSCFDLKHIYILMRKRKYDTLEERVRKYFQDEVFEVLKKSNKNFLKKVKVFNGDLTLDKLGLSKEDEDIVKKETNIIIHNAANVKFNAKLSDILKTNVIGTKYMLDLAEQCENLEVFLYVSSAYSHNYRFKIEEVFYPTTINLSMIYDMIDADSKSKNGLTKEAEKMLLGDFMNSYSFSKAAAEELVKQRAEKVTFPCGVFRPSLVTCTYDEPIRGWIENMNGPTGLFLVAGLGICHVAYVDGIPVLDYAPCDMVINALIAITKDIPDRCTSEKRAVVYNYGTSVTNPIDVLTMRYYGKNMDLRSKSFKTVWVDNMYITNVFVIFLILHFTIHLIPAIIIDLVFLLSSKKPRIMSLFFRFTKNLNFLLFLMHGNLRIHMPETLKVIDKLNPADKALFHCDPRKIDWEEYTSIGWAGIRRYLLKEDLNSEKNVRKYRRILWAHYSLITVVILFFTYLYIKMVYSLFY